MSLAPKKHRSPWFLAALVYVAARKLVGFVIQSFGDARRVLIKFRRHIDLVEHTEKEGLALPRFPFSKQFHCSVIRRLTVTGCVFRQVICDVLQAGEVI